MRTLAAALAATVRHNPNRVAIRDRERSHSWAEFGDRVARGARMLADLGVAPGERFGILARNGFRYEELKWAGYWSGAVPVPINWRLAPPEMRHILEDSDCRLLVVEDAFAGVLGEEAAAPWKERVLMIGPAPAGGALGEYDDLIGQARRADANLSDPDDDAILLYTGGTTGRSKGVRLSHANILSNALAFGLGVGARREDVYLHVAPMFHSADLLATAWILQGAGHCYLADFSPEAFFRTVERHRATAMVTVPAMLMMIVSDPGFAAADLSSVRVLIYGAAPMAVEWIERVAEAFPRAEFLNCYGLTETAPDLTIFGAREFREAIESGDRSGPLTSVGKPNVLNELRIVGPDGAEVAVGEPGELLARGPNIMNGYLNLPQETAAAVVDGWLHTGDIARMDEDGYIYLLDRLKDMVISGGENIYSSEVEAALCRHPGVREAAVIGVPDERLGEALFAAIVPKPDATLDEAGIVAHCRKHIGGYKIPRNMVFLEALPKSAMGKTLKTELRRTYGEPGAAESD